MSTERQCGSCGACCTELQIDEMGKPGGVPCPHLLPVELGQPGRCSRHKEDPRPCGRAADFQCLWLQGVGEQRERPDQLGVLWYVSPALCAKLGEEDAILAIEFCPGAYFLAGGVLSEWAKTRLLYLIQPGKKERLFGPEERVSEVRERLGM